VIFLKGFKENIYVENMLPKYELFQCGKKFLKSSTDVSNNKLILMKEVGPNSSFLVLDFRMSIRRARIK